MSIAIVTCCFVNLDDGDDGVPETSTRLHVCISKDRFNADIRGYNAWNWFSEPPPLLLATMTTTTMYLYR